MTAARQISLLVVIAGRLGPLKFKCPLRLAVFSGNKPYQMKLKTAQLERLKQVFCFIETLVQDIASLIFLHGLNTMSVSGFTFHASYDAVAGTLVHVGVELPSAQEQCRPLLDLVSVYSGLCAERLDGSMRVNNNISSIFLDPVYTCAH